MRMGSLKTLGIGVLFSFRTSEPDPLVQVLEELPHCTRISELELGLGLGLGFRLGLFLLDKVRHVTLYAMHQQYNLIHLHT